MIPDDAYDFCRISFQQRTDEGYFVYCDPNEEWDECIIGPLSTYSSYGEQRIENGPHAEFMINSLIHLLRQAYELGQRAKLSQIQQMLGIKHG